MAHHTRFFKTSHSSLVKFWWEVRQFISNKILWELTRGEKYVGQDAWHEFRELGTASFEISWLVAGQPEGKN